MRYTYALLLLITLAAGWLRLSGLDARSVTHPEMYVPGIRLPHGLSEPHERTTLRQVLTGTFSSDTHPPGYYVAMWAWTRVFGAGIVSMRLPSALLGTACVPLLFWLGRLLAGSRAGLLAAALLAFNGYHVFYSQVARLFAMACFLALAATVLLVYIVRGARRPRLLSILYLCAMLAGLATHVFFWTVFATHIVWTLSEAWRSGAPFSVCRLQLLIMILATPLLASTAYQSANPVATLNEDAGVYFADFFRFGFAIPGGHSGFFPSPPPFLRGGLQWTVARAALLALALALLATGVARRGLALDPYGSPGWTPPRWTLWTAAALSAVAITAFVRIARAYVDPLPTLAITERMTPLPFAFLGGGLLVETWWARRAGAPPKRPADGRILAALLALLPVALLGAASLVRPLLNQRGLMFATPYALLLLAAGIEAASRRAAVRGLLAGVAGGAMAFSLWAYRDMRLDPVDYRAFIGDLAPQLQPGDLVLLERRWNVTPILYYLHPEGSRLLAKDYAAACRREPAQRVWALALYQPDICDEMKSALAGYETVRTVERPMAKAVLYRPR